MHSSRCLAPLFSSYFNDEDEAKEDDGLPYQPAPGSPGAEALQHDESDVAHDSDASDDPLDAFMMGIEVCVHFSNFYFTE